MADANPTLIDAFAAAVAKLWPGLLGSLIALRWLPAETTRTDRAIAAIGGFAAASTVGPMIADLSGVQSVRIESGIVFVVGLFGMAVVGELMSAIKEVGIPTLARDFIRKLFRLGG
jgi:hypothetical protein